MKRSSKFWKEKSPTRLSKTEMTGRGRDIWRRVGICEATFVYVVEESASAILRRDRVPPASQARGRECPAQTALRYGRFSARQKK